VFVVVALFSRGGGEGVPGVLLDPGGGVGEDAAFEGFVFEGVEAARFEGDGRDGERYLVREETDVAGVVGHLVGGEMK